MASLPTSKVLISDKDNCKIATNIFQKYIDNHLEGKLFWESIKIDFKNWTKENSDIINSKT